MRTSLHGKFSKLYRMRLGESLLLVCLVLAVSYFAGAQQGKSEPAKADLTGRYEGSAKNRAEEVIDVTLELTEKDGALSGTIHSSHGDFPVTTGSRQGKSVTLEFEAQGTSGTISLEANDDKLVGTWSAGDDGGRWTLRGLPRKMEHRRANPKLSEVFEPVQWR